MKSLAERVENPIELDANGVWRLPGLKDFDYSDGKSHEHYLRGVFAKAADLGSDSYELEGHIRDWVTEYHLSRKRSQLLRGFRFDKSDRVLEVGCGCGAITRFLGETFADVVAVEGSQERATLARMRTRAMPHVSILSAPFQDVRFKERFDIIFCIGVFEYSKLYVDGADPHAAVLRGFADLLTPGGTVVVAIENQFGLKYFGSSAEDHNGIMYDGLEGYPRFDAHRTFGYNELRQRLQREFAQVRFFFPYPDYKLTSCVLSEDAFGKVRLGELLGAFAPRDYSKKRDAAFDQRLVLMELARNGLLHLFSNSFLVVASLSGPGRIGFDGLGVLFSDRRRKEFQTVMRITGRADGSIWAEKRRLGAGLAQAVSLRDYDERWQTSDSIQMAILLKAKRRDIAFSELFEPCALWMKRIRSLAVRKSGELVVDGRYVDCLWANSFVENGECVFIDNEWIWKGDIRVSVLVLRCAHYLLKEVGGMRDLNPQIAGGPTPSLVARIGRELGVELGRRDWREFRELETAFVGAVSVSKKRKARLPTRIWRALS